MRDRDGRGRRGASRTIVRAAASLALAALVAGCAPGFETSKRRIDDLVEARRQARGAWIEIRYPQRPRTIAGELIAAAADSVHVLTSAGLEAVPSDDFARAAVAVYEAPSQKKDPPVFSGRQGGDRWKALAPHARFPQGLPAGFDRTSLTAP